MDGKNKLKTRNYYFFNNYGKISGVMVIMVLLGLLAVQLVGGQFPQILPSNNGAQVALISPILENAKNNLQLYYFEGITVTPSPIPIPAGNACASNPFNDEPDIFLASDPASGVAAPGGQIKVWVDDGNGGSVSLGTKFDASGRIVTPGDRTGNDGRGANYYLWEPAIYLTPVADPSQPGPFAGDAENGGTPYFPIIVKGEVFYADQGNLSGFIAQLPPIDPPVNVKTGRTGHGGHIAEFIWDVNSLGLAPGSGYYRVQMVVHDGDGDLAVNCTTILM